MAWVGMATGVRRVRTCRARVTWARERASSGTRGDCHLRKKLVCLGLNAHPRARRRSGARGAQDMRQPPPPTETKALTRAGWRSRVGEGTPAHHLRACASE